MICFLQLWKLNPCWTGLGCVRPVIASWWKGEPWLLLLLRILLQTMCLSRSFCCRRFAPRSCTPHSGRRGCNGRWPWASCHLSSATSWLSAWKSVAGSNGTWSGRAVSGPYWRTPLVRSVMSECNVPHNELAAPSAKEGDKGIKERSPRAVQICDAGRNCIIHNYLVPVKQPTSQPI